VSERAHRGTIFLEDGEVVDLERCEADQFVLRVRAPRCAQAARPGSFAHVTCDPLLPMRRPLSIMRADAGSGCIELLYKIVGPGLRALSARRKGDPVSVLGPIGRGFETHTRRPRPLLIGGGVGIPPMIFLAETLVGDTRADWRPFVLMGSEIPFPFRARPSTILVPGMPADVIAAMPALERAGIPSRLASFAGYAGCHPGYVTELACLWLETLAPDALAEVELFACGPTPMLAATAAVARRFGLPCQVSLEEFMACAVGGCAGCTVRVLTAEGPAMQRVCVDGPVFDAAVVFPAAAT
jgi:dihydroorotate dehydrogenase electron transfer subunit